MISGQLETAAPPWLSDGRAALRRGEWESAREHLETCVEHKADCAEAWEGLGTSCYWLQDFAKMFEARQEAYRLYRARSDSLSAARVATWIGSDFLEFRGEAAVAAGWLERARQLLEDSGPSSERAWLHTIEAHFVLVAKNDPEAARAIAVEGRDLARQLGDVDSEMLARATEGLALVAEGEISEGIRLLDGAAAAALGGDMADLNAISVTCCFLIQACERVGDFGRASEWCGRFEEICARWRLGTFLTFCRLQHGMVLMWRGDWAAAEAELRAARSDFERFRPAARSAALVRLGELRRRQGRWEEAAQLLDEARGHRLATLWRGALALDRGDPGRAEDAALHVLRRAPSSNAAERLPALDLLVRSRAARGAVDEAMDDLMELEAAAAAIGTDTANGIALYAAGAIARSRGNEEDGRQLLRDATEVLASAGCPFEEANARLELASSLFALRRETVAREEAAAALQIYERLGAARGIEAARELLEHPPRLGPGSARPGASSPLTGRQLDVLRLVASGLTNREVAARLSLSEFTVRRHLANIYSRLSVSSRAAAVARALQQDLL